LSLLLPEAFEAFLEIKNKWKRHTKRKKKTIKPCGVQPCPLPHPAGMKTDRTIIQ